MPIKQYNLELNEEHVAIINSALDLFSRVLMGQLDEVEATLRWHDSTHDFAKFEELRHILKRAKATLGHPSNGSYGIHQPEVHDRARQAYDIQQVLRYVDAWAREGKNPKTDIRTSDMMQVSYDEPSKSSHKKDFKLPVMTVVNPIVKKLEAFENN
jgi:hypothetical protein